VDEQTWLWLTCIIMLLASAVIFTMGKKRTPGEEMQTILHGLVPIVAACSYFAMATGQGGIHLGAAAPGGREFLWARYADWTFTTPMLLLALSGTAMHSGLRRGGAIYGLIGSDVLMILTALFFGLSEVAWIKWTWFLVSCLAFLGVYYVMYAQLMEENAREKPHVQSVYRRDALLLAVVWFLYPIVLALSPDGLGTISATAGVALIAILDITAKVVFGILSTVSDTQLTDEQLQEPGTRDAGRFTTTVRPVAAE